MSPRAHAAATVLLALILAAPWIIAAVVLGHHAWATPAVLAPAAAVLVVSVRDDA